MYKLERTVWVHRLQPLIFKVFFHEFIDVTELMNDTHNISKHPFKHEWLVKQWKVFLINFRGRLKD